VNAQQTMATSPAVIGAAAQDAVALTPILDRITAPNRRVLRWLALRGNAARQLRSTGHATSTRSERNS
jgi:hypothetical protein